MKRTTFHSSALLRVAALGCGLALAALPSSAQAQYDDAPQVGGAVGGVGGAVDLHSSVGNFYNVLAPYGSWVNSSLGWAWVPHRNVVGAGFVPYASNGSWTATDQGWMFNSNYSWGWAPFHYGRWFQDPNYGWAWIPGTDWAPAWVSWRWGGGYVGWYPQAPDGYTGGHQRWIYMPSAYLTYPQPLRYRLRRHLWGHAARRTRVIAGAYRHSRGWHRGPPATVVRPRYVVHVRAPRSRVLARVSVHGKRAHVARYGSGSVNIRRRPGRRPGYRGAKRRPGQPGYRAARPGRVNPGYRGAQRRPGQPGYRAAQPGRVNPGYRGAQPRKPGYRAAQPGRVNPGYRGAQPRKPGYRAAQPGRVNPGYRGAQPRKPGYRAAQPGRVNPGYRGAQPRKPGYRAAQPGRVNPGYRGAQRRKPGYRAAQPGRVNPGYRGAQPRRPAPRVARPARRGTPSGRRGNTNTSTVNHKRRKPAVPAPARHGPPAGKRRR